jgi:hypothetical protein
MPKFLPHRHRRPIAQPARVPAPVQKQAPAPFAPKTPVAGPR